nr:NADH dehydrogenase [ubiquinone] 1 alpha subcomplex assembly factor 8 [Onthophagus taurus]
MESVQKARHRFRQYPFILAGCKTEAGNYAKCVLKKSSIEMNDCATEFKLFKNCLQKSAAKLKTKI